MASDWCGKNKKNREIKQQTQIMLEKKIYELNIKNIRSLCFTTRLHFRLIFGSTTS